MNGTLTREKMYQFIKTGDKPMNVLKEQIEYLKQVDPAHPLLKAKGFELVALPLDHRGITPFIEDFITSKAEPNKVYIAIVKLGAAEYHQQESIEMTGKCKVNENLVKGARKWETLYVTYEVAPKKQADGTVVYLPLQRGKHETKGEAMSFAKQYAIDNDTEVFVELEKRLIGSTSRIADIKPIKRTVHKTIEKSTNKFAFFGRSE